jgi:carboxyl-terminal processing protease
VYAAIAGEASSLRDPYTVFFTASEERSFYRYLNPVGFGGIGILVHVDEGAGRVVIDEAFPDGPADKAGLQPGDWIDAIDGVPTHGASTDAIEARFRGKAGSIVRLSYGRGDAEVNTSLALVRARVQAPDVIGHLFPGGVGYVHVTSYGSNAAKELDTQLRRLAAQGARGYVLDLRDDGGGYRDAAIEVTSHFVPSGPVVIVQERSGRRTAIDALHGMAIAKPYVVLVDGNTASAAEITAAAIQDSGHAQLVGVRTFGKGLVQQMFPLPDGAALKVTVEHYFSPRGRDIDKRGIDPDVVVAQPSGAVIGDPAHDPQLERAIAVLQAAPVPQTPAP